MAVGQGPQGTHTSQETFVTATPPPKIPGPLDPGYVKPIRTLQMGPQGNTSQGVAHGWPDSFQRP
jgi:hypothetical protein